MNHSPLQKALDDVSAGVESGVKSYSPQIAEEEIGRVRSVSEGIVWVEGLHRAGAEELVVLGGKYLGMVLDILPNRLGIILMNNAVGLKAGMEVTRTGRILEVPVSEALIGRTVDPLGRPLDGEGELPGGAGLPVFREAPAIMDRAPVSSPLQTGIKVVDALIPIGRGQRELILGDRQTGKTAVAIDTIINQHDKDVICIYCSIGQRSSSTAKVIGELKRQGAMKYCFAVVAEGNDPPGLQYIAPYAATTMAEHFMAEGRDVLIIYDDLTRHALAYRQISLLLRRPPGREAFPGDIFYVHSRLLERSTRLKSEAGGGSLTALPVIETEAQNISAYIPTNLISITDGQIYLSPDLFQKGIIPAIDVGKSVSRVGGKAQRTAFRKVAGDLRLSYSQFQELETFARFGTRLDEKTRKSLDHGRRVREILKQDQYVPMTVAEQVAVLWAANKNLFDEVPLEQVREAEKLICEMVLGTEGLVKELADAEKKSPAWERLEKIIPEALAALPREAGKEIGTESDEKE